MGRTARFKIPMMADLVRQLQFTPAETLCRQMDNAERLAGEVEAGEKYPWEYVLFRITGFRTDRGQEPMLISGADVRSDAAIFVLRASSAADIERDYAGRSAIGLKALAKRLKVTGTTIQRYRTQGLICHAVRKRGKVRETHELVCFEDSLARFLAGLSRNGKEVGRLTRMSDAETEAAVQQARELREMKRASLNDAAKAIAERMGRSHEAVRQLLKRHDRDAEEAIFTERGPIGERGKEFVLRAWERGVSVGQIAKRLGKSSPAVHHALAQARAKRLKGWEISHVEMPTFELPDAERVILSSPWVSTGLMEAIASKITEVAAAQGMPELEENAEQAMVGGYNFLKRKAAQVIAGLGATPKIAEVDEAETLLRWAMLVKAKLVRGVMGSCIRQVERSLGKAFGTLRESEQQSHVRMAQRIISETTESVDPSRGQSLTRLSVMAIDREMAKQTREQRGRLARKNVIDEKEAALTQWESALGLSEAMREGLKGIDVKLQRVVEMKYGLEGGPPRTNEEVARMLAMTGIAVARGVQRGVREGRKAIGTRQ